MPNNDLPVPSSPQTTREFCETYILPNYPDVDLGRCVGFFENFINETNGVIPFQCMKAMLWDDDFEKNYKNFGDCIRKSRKG